MPHIIGSWELKDTSNGTWKGSDHFRICMAFGYRGTWQKIRWSRTGNAAFWDPVVQVEKEGSQNPTNLKEFCARSFTDPSLEN